MFDWFRQFPDMVLIAAAAATSLGLVALTGLLPPRDGSEPPSPTSASALQAYEVIVAFTAILLSLALVQAVGELRTTEIAVSREAGAINMLDRVLTRYGTPGTVAARPLLAAYGASLVTAEWPAMQRGEDSDATAVRLRAVNRAVQTLEGGLPSKPVLYAEMLKQLDAMNDARQERLDSNAVGLPRVLWEAAGALSAVLLLLTCFIRVRSRMITVGGHAMAIAVLATLVFVVDQPFKGQTFIGPDSIERVLTAIQARTE